MAAVEESKVREAAISSIRDVLTNLPDEHLNLHFVPFVVDLAKKEWFTSR